MNPPQMPALMATFAHAMLFCGTILWKTGRLRVMIFHHVAHYCSRRRDLSTDALRLCIISANLLIPIQEWWETEVGSKVGTTPPKEGKPVRYDQYGCITAGRRALCWTRYIDCRQVKLRGRLMCGSYQHQKRNRLTVWSHWCAGGRHSPGRPPQKVDSPERSNFLVKYNPKYET